MEWFENEDFWRDFYEYMFSEERFAAAKDEVSRVIDLTHTSGGRLLDLCCGPGRHAVEFAQRGFAVTGVDRSVFLLDRARQHARASGVSVEWINEDMRRFVRQDSFDLACNLFTSFGYFEDEQDDLTVLKNVYRSLRDHGVLVMEMIGKERLARVWQNAMCFDLPDGSVMVQRPQVRSDWSRVRTEWILIKDGQSKTAVFEHWIYSGRELKERLLSCGFEQVELFGNTLGAPYDVDAQRLVAVARK
ncbi:MAG TPA: methyltransferase domain-containing protein [Candidatus Angelobacter sp.]|nr:methyltransferase domain-containing protein [Candidatus Angelobacter sp.]